MHQTSFFSAKHGLFKTLLMYFPVKWHCCYLGLYNSKSVIAMDCCKYMNRN